MQPHAQSADVTPSPRRSGRARASASPSPAAVRKRRQRANHNAERYYCRGFWLSARAVEGLIMRLVLEGRLTEAQAMEPKPSTRRSRSRGW